MDDLYLFVFLVSIIVGAVLWAVFEVFNDEDDK
jgi:hypothetical protein